MLRFLPNYRVYMQKNPQGYKEPRTYSPIIKPLGNQNPLSLKFLAAAKVIDTVSGTSTDYLAKQLGVSLAHLRMKKRESERRLPVVTEDSFGDLVTAEDYATYLFTVRLNMVFQVSETLDSVLLPLYVTSALSVVPKPTAIEKYSTAHLRDQIEPLYVVLEHFSTGKPAYNHLVARLEPNTNLPRYFIKDLRKMRRRGNGYAEKAGDLVAELKFRSSVTRWTAKASCGAAVSLLIAVVELAKATDARAASIIEDINIMGIYERADQH